MPSFLYLARGMLGWITCVTNANPPVTYTSWSKDDLPINIVRTNHRIRVTRLGTLVLYNVRQGDHGLYTCTPYSGLGPGRVSTAIRIIVRGIYES